MELKNKYVILLLTNRDSDNIGDQVIENSDIGLLHALMRNLGFSKSEYQISSRSASIITKKYMKTRDPLLLQNAKDAISTGRFDCFWRSASIQLFVSNIL